jgi:hypothetical protein
MTEGKTVPYSFSLEEEIPSERNNIPTATRIKITGNMQ